MEESLICPVCFGEDWLTKSKCNHLICISCLLSLQKNSCPTCRRPLYNTLPNGLKYIVKMSSNKKKNQLNIEDLSEFPELR